MLTKFVRAALGWGYGRLRGRPSQPELCFNDLSLPPTNHFLTSGNGGILYVTAHVCLSHLAHLSPRFLSHSLSFPHLTSFITLHSVLLFIPFLPTPPPPQPHPTTVFQTSLPRHISIGQIASAWRLLNCGNSVAERTTVWMCGEHVSLLQWADRKASSTWRGWKSRKLDPQLLLPPALIPHHCLYTMTVIGSEYRLHTPLPVTTAVTFIQWGRSSLTGILSYV